MALQANNTVPQLSQAQEKSLEAKTRGLPSFKVRHADAIEKTLKSQAIADGFVSVPIHTFIDTVWEDPLQVSSCDLVHRV